jgi:succinyl-CoA synthetase beta subunit
MLNANLITNQTGVEGRPCKNVLIQERIYARHEYYFAGNYFFKVSK